MRTAGEFCFVLCALRLLGRELIWERGRPNQKCHAVVFGRDPFEKLVIAPQHRRLRIEQELREARITLRRAVQPR